MNIIIIISLTYTESSHHISKCKTFSDKENFVSYTCHCTAQHTHHLHPDTESIFYCCAEHRRCHWMARRLQACYARCSDDSASSDGMATVFRIRKATEANSGAAVSRCFGLYSSGLTPCSLVDRSVSDVLWEEHLLVEVRRRSLPHPTSKYGAQSRLDLGPGRAGHVWRDPVGPSALPASHHHQHILLVR